MKRTTSKAQIIHSIETLRKELPEISIRTSLIVGFPGESESQFEELCNFVNSYALDNVGIFAYSKEELSHSASLPGHLSEEVKEARCEHLSAVQFSHVKKRNLEMVGQRIPVIIDGYHPETKLLMVARRPGQCPEIDPVVLLNDFGSVRALGETYLVEITDIADYDLVGKVIQSIQKSEWK